MSERFSPDREGEKFTSKKKKIGLEKAQTGRAEQKISQEQRDIAPPLAMEFRHQMAVAGFEIEQAFSEGKLLSFSENTPGSVILDEQEEMIREMREKLEGVYFSQDTTGRNDRKKLPATLEKRFSIFTGGMRRYAQESRRVQAAESSLSAAIGSHQPDELGAYFFLDRMGESGRAPRGRVTVYAQEAYLIVAIEDPLDFAYFLAGKGDALTNQERTHGEASSGFYRTNIQVDHYNFPCLVLKMDLPNDAATHPFSERWQNEPAHVREVVLHERQHFINDTAFLNFPEEVESAALSKRGEEEYRITNQTGLRAAKDELLARLREESSSPDFCTDFFDDQLYLYIKEYFIRSERPKVRALLKDIKKELERIYASRNKDTRGTVDLFGGEKNRALLVHHLVDIPLTYFPEALRQIGEFYKQKPELLFPQSSSV